MHKQSVAVVVLGIAIIAKGRTTSIWRVRSDLRTVVFSAGSQSGAFRFAIDDARLR